MMFAVGEPEQKERDGCDQSRGRGNREPGEVLAAVRASRSFVIRRRGVKTRETQRAAREINERDYPTCVWKFVEHDAINHQRRRETKGNDIGQRIELAPERALMAAEARESPIQEIENERAENEPNGGMKKVVCRIDIRALQQRAFQNFKRGSKSTKQISRRH